MFIEYATYTAASRSTTENVTLRFYQYLPEFLGPNIKHCAWLRISGKEWARECFIVCGRSSKLQSYTYQLPYRPIDRWLNASSYETIDVKNVFFTFFNQGTFLRF